MIFFAKGHVSAEIEAHDDYVDNRLYCLHISTCQLKRRVYIAVRKVGLLAVIQTRQL
jgi:hypothetical protein